MIVTFGAPDTETRVEPKNAYRTPGDPECPTTNEPEEWQRMPLWMDSYFRCSIDTEYPDFALDDPALLEPPSLQELRTGSDWPTSAAQKRELERLGLPLARSWRMAKYLLDQATTPADKPTKRTKVKGDMRARIDVALMP